MQWTAQDTSFTANVYCRQKKRRAAFERPSARLNLVNLWITFTKREYQSAGPTGLVSRLRSISWRDFNFISLDIGSPPLDK